MKKKTMDRITLTALGCAALLGVGTASVPVHAMSSLPAPATANANVSASVAQSSAITAKAKAEVAIGTKMINYHSKLVDLKVKIPVVKGLKDKHYQEEMNYIIASHAEKDIQELKQQAWTDYLKAKKGHLPIHKYELNVSYNIKYNATGMLSFTITTYNSFDGMTRVDAYNVYNQTEANRITLGDMWGEGYKEKISEQIKKQIAKKPIHKVYSFESISNDQTFYIEGGSIVIVFQKYEIAPGSEGVQEFRIALPRV